MSKISVILGAIAVASAIIGESFPLSKIANVCCIIGIILGIVGIKKSFWPHDVALSIAGIVLNIVALFLPAFL